MSCNPSIGGIGKSHLVKEIDALGGVMAIAADESGIQFRVLNSSKGPAVRSTRAQVDRVLYKKAIKSRLENQKNLWLFQQSVEDLIILNNKVKGVITQSGLKFFSQVVILTVGTFLNGKIHEGLSNYSGGRAGDQSSITLSDRLKEMKLPQGRLKTGTPPRLDGRSINFSYLAKQNGDTNPIPIFSFLGDEELHPNQVPCWITHTNLKTHNIISSSIDNSPGTTKFFLLIICQLKGMPVNSLSKIFAFIAKICPFKEISFFVLLIISDKFAKALQITLSK